MVRPALFVRDLGLLLEAGMSGASSSGAGQGRIRKLPSWFEAQTKALHPLTWLLARRLAAINVEVALASDLALVPCSQPLARVRLSPQAPVVRLLTRPDPGFGEAYVEGSVKVEGDLVAVLEALARAGAPEGRLPEVGRGQQLLDQVLATLRRDSAREADVARVHYDLGNDFYRPWLGPTMTYTCAYWVTSEVTLAQAQVAKMNLVCRKLDLQPGQRVVEAGCGWGTLAMHMAEHYGVSVDAFNISGEQVAWAKEAVRRRGLEGRVRIIEDDVRNAHGRFDRFAAVGMLEAVQPKGYPEIGRLMDRLLGPEGRGLLHSIGRPRPYPTSAWVDRYIFPGGYTPSLRELLALLEPHGFVATDVENLRLHYVRTLEAWLASFETIAEAIAVDRGEDFVRMWRLYLASAIAAFRAGWLQLFQVVFERSARVGSPSPRSLPPPQDLLVPS